MLAPLWLILVGCQTEADTTPDGPSQAEIDALSERLAAVEARLPESEVVGAAELDAYATEAWVEASYATNQDLDDALPDGTIATESWVDGAIADALPLGTIATRSWVEQGFATPQDVTDVLDGTLPEDPIATQTWASNTFTTSTQVDDAIGTALSEGDYLTQSIGDGRYVQTTQVADGLAFDGQGQLVVEAAYVEDLAEGVAYHTREELTNALQDTYLSTTQGDLLLDGAVRLAGAGAGCSADEVGLVRYVGGAFEGCTPDGWLILGGGPGTTASQAVASCEAVLVEQPTAPSGLYWLEGTQGPYQAWCDQTWRGGGWLAVFNYQPVAEDDAAAAALYDALTTNAAMEQPASPTSHSGAILTSNVPLAGYTEVAYGWVPAGADSPTRWGTYARDGGLAGECYLDGYCGDDTTIATMRLHPTGSERSIRTGNNPSYPHVGLGWGSQQIVWGYDQNVNNGSPWGNWNDQVSCCHAGNTTAINDAGWRYVIYLR